MSRSVKDDGLKTSVYVGVSWRKDISRWNSQIKFNKNNYGLGVYLSETDAHEAYQKVLMYINSGADNISEIVLEVRKSSDLRKRFK